MVLWGKATPIDLSLQLTGRRDVTGPAEPSTVLVGRSVVVDAMVVVVMTVAASGVVVKTVVRGDMVVKTTSRRLGSSVNVALMCARTGRSDNIDMTAQSTKL
jgi:hypothetical protein